MESRSVPRAAVSAAAPGDDLAGALSTPGTLAVFLDPPRSETWLDELSAAVEQGRFQIPRTELDGLDLDALATWLDRHLPRAAVSHGTRDALLSDILRLAHVVEDLTAAGWYKLRILTAAPDRRCGFHVDTVPPGAPVWGVLRVYNGEGTDWVEPSQVRSMAAFYEWLHQRDRVVRELAEPARDSELSSLDSQPEFLTESADVQRVPAGTTVLFKHLDAGEHWGNHGAHSAWIHCSPMAGKPRLVVNISPHRREGR